MKLLCLLSVLIFMNACDSKKAPDKPLIFHQKNGESVQKATNITPIANSLKKLKLGGYQNKTIGEAFDNYKYAERKEWKETDSKSNVYYIDYICWLDLNKLSATGITSDVAQKAINIKFVVRENGEASIAMASKIEIKTDGKSYTNLYEITEIKNLIDAIYNDKRIDL